MDDEARIAKVMRAIYLVLHPDFEDVGQPISQMRFLDQHHDARLEKMARAAIAALEK